MAAYGSAWWLQPRSRLWSRPTGDSGLSPKAGVRCSIKEETPKRGTSIMTGRLLESWEEKGHRLASRCGVGSHVITTRASLRHEPVLILVFVFPFSSPLGSKQQSPLDVTRKFRGKIACYKLISDFQWLNVNAKYLVALIIMPKCLISVIDVITLKRGRMSATKSSPRCLEVELYS